MSVGDNFLTLSQTGALTSADLYTEKGEEYREVLTEELPLELCIQGNPHAVFMRTPGHDQDLITGFLRTEGIISSAEDIDTLIPCLSDPSLRIHLTLASGVRAPTTQRHSTITSSCGLCSLTAIEEIRAIHTSSGAKRHATFSQFELDQIIHKLDTVGHLFKLTGGSHGAALFAPDGTFFGSREDVGRHNALDKVIGAALRSEIEDFNGWLLAMSSRAGVEIVAKALRSGVSALITVGAASGGAHRLAQEHGFPLYSFTRLGRCHRHQAPCK